MREGAIGVILILIAIGLAIGVPIGICLQEGKSQHQAIKNKAAHYHPETGEFTWNKPTLTPAPARQLSALKAGEMK